MDKVFTFLSDLCFSDFFAEKNLLKIQTSFTHLKKKKIDFLFKKMKKLHYKIEQI